MMADTSAEVPLPPDHEARLENNGFIKAKCYLPSIYILEKEYILFLIIKLKNIR